MLNIIFTIVAIVILLSVISGKNNNNKIPATMPEPMIGNGDSDLTIVKVDNSQKINALKEVREITGYDLYSAKNIIENIPFKLMRNVRKEYAEEMKERLTRCGITTEITESEIKV